MCGLAGVVSLTGEPPSDAAVSRALEALSRRGPDVQHVRRDRFCTLLHTRLRIIDLDPRADQPMERTRNQRVVMVYNGEVYNFPALRNELRKAGWNFTTTSDSEVLLAGYLTWGTDVFRRARGMWAIALWHPETQRVVLARDPLGKKPLMYTASPMALTFASNVTALLGLLDHIPQLDRAALDCYLGHLVVPFEHSMFEGVRKVPPGGVVTWEPGREARVERYWRLPEPGRMTVEDASAEVERLLRQAIRRRLQSDVPLGVFLSAGYDSGLVAALASQESRRQMVAVTAGTTGSGYDERAAAGLVAERFGMQHHLLEVPALSASALPTLVGELGEPFGDASLLPSYDVARAARQSITVALTGDGGDEGFFGYPTFRAVWLAEWYRRCVPRLLRRALRAWTRRVTGDTWRRRAAALLDYGADPLAVGFRNRMGFSREERSRLLPDGSPRGHVAEHVYGERLARWRELPDADALRRTFFETFLPNDYLTKVDTATMAASLEARCPFLDLDLVELTLGLPAGVVFPGGTLKALLRPLVHRYLPAGTVGRSKTGFGVPVGQWLRGPLRPAFERFVVQPGTLMAELVDSAAARVFLSEHLQGADHATRLWGLLCLGVWAAVVVERRWSAQEPLPVGSMEALQHAG